MAAADTKLMKNLKIRAIVSLHGPNLDYDPPQEAEVLHRYFPDGTAINHEMLKEILEFIDEHYHSGENILIHCAMGISRSASITIAWLMHHFPGLSWERAEAEVLRKRMIWPAEEIKMSILSYFAPKKN
jgi:protein-tyrosine phosphatase